jgi:hypothetical protein
MNEIAITVLSLACATLCVGVAGLLRRVVDVKLALGGYDGERRQFMVDIGRKLPEPVIAKIPYPEDRGLIVVASRSCEACHQVVEELDGIGGQVLVGVMAGEGVALDTGDVPLLSEEATEQLVAEFGLSQIPVAIAQQDGYVVGAAYGEALAVEGGLGRFWATIADTRVEVPA